MKTRIWFVTLMLAGGTSTGTSAAQEPRVLDPVPSFEALDLLGVDPESRGWTFVGFEAVEASAYGDQAPRPAGEPLEDAEYPLGEADQVVYRLALRDGSVYEKIVDLSATLEEVTSAHLPGNQGVKDHLQPLADIFVGALHPGNSSQGTGPTPTQQLTPGTLSPIRPPTADALQPRPDLSILPSDNPYNPAYDDRWVVNSSTSLSSYPLRTMGHILGSETGKSGGCSGALIGPRHVLTAGHCVYDRDSGTWSWGTWFSPGHRGRGSSRFVNGTPRRVVGLLSVTGYTVNGDWTADYGMMILEDEARTASLGWLGLCSFSDSYLSGRSMGVHGYPLWNKPCGGAGSPRSDGLCGSYMYYDWCSVANTWSRQLGYQCDTQPGQSGSPAWLWYSGDPCVIAIHAYGEGSRNDNRNRGTRLSSSRISRIRDWICDFPSAHATYGACP